MARTTRYDENEVKAALNLVAEAKTIQELRQGNGLGKKFRNRRYIGYWLDMAGARSHRICAIQATLVVFSGRGPFWSYESSWPLPGTFVNSPYGRIGADMRVLIFLLSCYWTVEWDVALDDN